MFGSFTEPFSINNIIVSGEAILSAEHIEKPLGGRGLIRTPLGSSQRFPRPSSWWRMVAAPPKEPMPRSQSSALRSRPNEKFWTRSCSPLVHSVIKGNLDFVVIIVTKEVKKFAYDI